MKRKKWEPVIINIMADGSRVEDLTKYVIPSGHAYYYIIQGIYKKGAWPNEVYLSLMRKKTTRKWITSSYKILAWAYKLKAY